LGVTARNKKAPTDSLILPDPRFILAISNPVSLTCRTKLAESHLAAGLTTYRANSDRLLGPVYLITLEKGAVKSLFKKYEVLGRSSIHLGSAVGWLGWYSPNFPPLGREIRVIEPQRACWISEHWMPSWPNLAISALRSSHIR
jgi:hypothetical protein